MAPELAVGLEVAAEDLVVRVAQVGLVELVGLEVQAVLVRVLEDLVVLELPVQVVVVAQVVVLLLQVRWEQP